MPFPSALLAAEERIIGLCLKEPFETIKEYHGILLKQSDEFPITLEYMEGKFHTGGMSSRCF